MKLSSRLFLLIFLLFPSLVSAEVLFCGGEPGFDVIVESFIVPVDLSGATCEQWLSATSTDQAAAYFSKGWYVGCDVVVCAFADNCSIIRVEVWCQGVAPLNNANNIQQTVMGNQTVTGVTLGGEMQAAEAVANAFFTANQYPVVAGKVRTDGAAGFSYTTTMGAGGTQAEVAVVAWKRGIYTNAGSNPIPLGDLGGTGSGGGSGGGGANAAEIQTAMEAALAGTGTRAALALAVEDGLDSNQVSRQDILTAFEEALWNSQNLFGGGGGGTGGMTAAEMAQLLTDHFGGQGFGPITVPGALNPVLAGNTDVAVKSNFMNGISSVFSGFSDNMKTTGIYTAISGFFGGVPSAGAAPVVQIAGGQLGDHSFDFSSWSSYLLILSMVLKIVFTFIAVRIVTVNGV